MFIKMNQSTVKRSLCISNVSDILQLVEQELLTLPGHMSSSSIVLCGLCCLIFSFLCSVIVHCLLCFSFLSLFLCELYCLSYVYVLPEVLHGHFVLSEIKYLFNLEGNILHIVTRNVIFFYDYSNRGGLSFNIFRFFM